MMRWTNTDMVINNFINYMECGPSQHMQKQNDDKPWDKIKSKL